MSSSTAFVTSPTRPRSIRLRFLVLFLLLATATITRGEFAFAQETGAPLQPLTTSSSLSPALSSGYGAMLPQSSLPEGESANSQPLSATLLGEPVYGTAPLTVDFYVSLTNPQPSIVYQWEFGDGAVSSMPPGAYMLHVYRTPGTYQCSLTLINAQGRSTTLFTTIVVRPPQTGASDLG
jgi:PKD repeat protein